MESVIEFWHMSIMSGACHRDWNFVRYCVEAAWMYFSLQYSDSYQIFLSGDVRIKYKPTFSFFYSLWLCDWILPIVCLRLCELQASEFHAIHIQQHADGVHTRIGWHAWRGLLPFRLPGEVSLSELVCFTSETAVWFSLSEHGILLQLRSLDFSSPTIQIHFVTRLDYALVRISWHQYWLLKDARTSTTQCSVQRNSLIAARESVYLIVWDRQPLLLACRCRQKIWSLLEHSLEDQCLSHFNLKHYTPHTSHRGILGREETLLRGFRTLFSETMKNLFSTVALLSIVFV
jgi:hypothetical protein